MWLLSTDRAELHYFTSPHAVPEGYAILSHVWDQQELSFQDMEKLRADCALTGQNPRDRASPKVRESCKLAEKHGYRWIWNDTCCIDKSSSAELSEAINSMFLYYSRSEVCYAYLRDVPSDCILEAEDSPLRTSVWHTRGWTLQELIAPNFLLLVAEDWSILSSKANLAELLSKVTNVPVSMLLRTTTPDSFSVAQRMSWASRRRTTRLEDEAYSLMGLFGINMPTIYGEGKNAFQRLQEEIMKQSVDTSLFVWGEAVSQDGLPELYPAGGSFLHDDHYLLASSPAAFAQSGNATYGPSLTTRVAQDEEGKWLEPLAENTLSATLGGIPTASSRPYGIHVHIPIVAISRFTIALLLCLDGTEHLGLLLSRQPRSLDQSRPLHRLGALTEEGRQTNVRIIRLGQDLNNLRVNGEQATPNWEEIYFAHRPRGLAMEVLNEPRHIPDFPFNCNMYTPFRVPERNIRKLVTDSQRPPLSFEEILFDDRDANILWTGSILRTLCFFVSPEQALPDHYYEIFVHLGRCTKPLDPEELPIPEPELGPHWARVDVDEFDGAGAETLALDSHSPLPTHDCDKDHIQNWTAMARSFIFPIRDDIDPPTFSFTVALAFTRCAINPAQTLVLDMSVSEEYMSTDTDDFRLLSSASPADINSIVETRRKPGSRTSCKWM
ncbi:heterokaryon incompatibility protein-domain-containing protein [Earliella scabrosa]|nr:heterokaryon incompatibility protein-domain-containing protein [Earliella scabrosa]